MNKFVLAFLGASLVSVCFSVQLQATSFISFDARSMAMGGTGTADGEPGTAALFNPALMASPGKALEKTYFAHTYAGARLIDRDSFIDRATALNDSDFESTLDSTLSNVRLLFKGGRLSPSDLRELSGKANRLLTDIQSVSNRPARASASIGLSAGRVETRVAYGLYARTYQVLGAEIVLAPLDVQRMQQLALASGAMADVIENADALEQLIDNLDLGIIESLARQSIEQQQVVPGLLSYLDIPGVDSIIEAVKTNQQNIEALLALVSIDNLEQALLAQSEGVNLNDIGLGSMDLRNIFRYQISEEFDSRINYAGADVNEIGFSVALKEILSPKLTVGFNLKHVKIGLIEFSQKLDEINFDGYKLGANRIYYNRLNLDVGGVYRLNNRYTAAIVIRNLIPYTLQTSGGTDISFDPIARVGIAYRSKRFNVAVDYDLTRNEPLGFDPDKRYLAIGMEWRAWKQNAFRFGYRYNAVDGSGLPSLGLGLGFRQGHMDMAVSRSATDDEFGVSLHAGFQF